MKNARLLALAAATILSGCAQGGIDPFAGSSAPPAPPAEDLQYFVRYPDGTMVPVQLPPSVVAGFGGPQSGAAQGSAQVGGVVYAPPLVASTPPASAPNFYAAPPPAGAARPVAAPQPAPQVAARQPAPYEFPAAPAAAPLPAALSAPRSSAPPASSGGFAQAATAPGIAQMDPALAEALRRQGIDPGDVVGLEYSDGPPAAASAPGSAAALNPQVVAPQRAMGMAPVASPRDADFAAARAPQTPAAPAPRTAAPARASAQGGGAPQMDPAVLEALRRQGIDPSEVVGLQMEGGPAQSFESIEIAAAPLAASASASSSAGGPLTRTSAAGAPVSSPTPRVSPVRRPNPSAQPAPAFAAAPAPAAPPAARPAAPAAPAAARPAAPAASASAFTGIAGSSWRLAMLRGQRVAPGVELHFDGAENFAGGSGPCSPYSFDFREGAGGALQVDGVGADPRSCDRSEEEERYFTALNLVSAYRVSSDGALDLLGPGGAVLASYQPL